MSKNMEIPNHIGFILDGNRRWAKSRNMLAKEGHRKGYQNLKTIGLDCLDRGVEYVSAYVFSNENWRRKESEVSYLMDLVLWVAKNELDVLHDKGVKLKVLGSRENLSKKVINAIEDAEEKTKNNKNGTFALCFNYGGEQEIVDATRKLIATGIKAKDVTRESFEKCLYASEVPPIDLLIRTSGEKRLSGFMLYRSSYAELYFVDKNWPDFNEDDLSAAIDDFSSRLRRFGS